MYKNIFPEVHKKNGHKCKIDSIIHCNWPLSKQTLSETLSHIHSLLHRVKSTTWTLYQTHKSVQLNTHAFRVDLFDDLNTHKTVMPTAQASTTAKANMSTKGHHAKFYSESVHSPFRERQEKNQTVSHSCIEINAQNYTSNQTRQCNFYSFLLTVIHSSSFHLSNLDFY